MAEAGFVLLAGPVEFEGAEGLELGDGRVEDYEVDVVAEVGPDGDEEAEIGDCDGGVQVVEGFGGLCVVLSAWVFVARRGDSLRGGRPRGVLNRGLLTARNKSLMSWVIYTANPI